MSAADEPSGARVEIGIAVVRHGGRYLIGLRPAGAPLAGYWEFPGGKLLPGENAAEAAVRECREETGLAVRVIGSYPVAEHDYQHAAVRLHFVACELDAAAADDVPRVPPRWRWVTAAELSGYQFPPANRALLVELQAAAR